MNKRKGFTLVELLAVIVILAIIMIIAIPSVLGTMTTARKKSFVEYATKVYMAAQSKYMSAQTLGLSDLGCSFVGNDGKDTVYYYDIRTDLGLENVGDYKGYAAVNKITSTAPKAVFMVMLYDSNYGLVVKDDTPVPTPYYEYTEEPDPDANLIDVDDDMYSRMITIFESKINRANKTINLVEVVEEWEALLEE